MTQPFPEARRAWQEYQARLERTVVRHGLGDRVALGGVLERSALPGLFAKHDLLLNDVRPGSLLD